MSKKILFLEDLYNFYSNNYKRSVHYSAEKTGEPIVVQMHGNVKFDEAYDSKAGLTPVHLMSSHIGENLNGSYIDEATMRVAMSSFQNRPILAFVHEVDGQLEFYTHNMHEDEDGNVVYDEKPVGVIPESCNAQLVYHEDLNKTYLEVDGYLYDEYSPAVSILKRERECACSIELFVEELSFDAKEKHLNLDKFWIQGITILGKTPDGHDVKPGMSGANIKLVDFNENNNSMFANFEIKMNELQDRLNKLESACSDIQFSKEGGNQEEMKFDELLKKYNKTVEDIDFDYENMSDEELETKFAELFDDGDPEPDPDTPADGNDPADPDPNDSGDDGKDDNDDDDDDGDDSGDDPEPAPEPEPEVTDGSDEDDAAYLKAHPNQYELVIKQGNKEFALSLQEKIFALCDLVNATYAESDNTYYFVNAFDSFVVMQDAFNGRYFKQSYTESDETFSLVGERVPVFAEFVTEEELNSLNDMRANYEALVQFKKESEENEEKRYFSVDKNSNVKVFANVNRSKESRYGNLFKR